MEDAYIRSYAPADLPALYDICVRTADAGGDARGQYSDDRLMGDLFAAPYATLESEHTYVVDAGGAVVGYVVGTADTSTFVKRYRAEWIPELASVWSPPPHPPTTPEQQMLVLHYWPERMLVPEVEAYPAHLHIDLLPEWQRRGFGRELITRFLASVAAVGAPAVHLGMLLANTSARAFYDRLGFTEIPVASADADGLVYLGRSTG